MKSGIGRQTIAVGGKKMTRIYQSAEEITGNTPLLRAGKLERRYSLNARLLLKLEYLNPTGSVKDRAALYMIRDAEQAGLLQPGGVIVEPTSGNTGIGLASLAASRGYRLILTMPETMSVERRNILKAYGAEIVLTEGSRGMSGAIEKAEEIVKSTPGAFLPGQFDNPSNARAHYETTGPEIWRDTQGQVDIFVAGVGTGGDAYRNRTIPERTESADPGSGCGAVRVPGSLRGKRRPSQDSGDRRGICALCARSGGLR